MNVHPVKRLTRSLLIFLLPFALATPLLAEVPPTYSRYLEDSLPNWISFDVIRQNPAILGATTRARLEDQLGFLQAERRPDSSGCLVAGHESHPPNARVQRAIAAFRESPDAAKDHSSLIIEGTLKDLAPGLMDGTEIGSLLEVSVSAEHRRTPELDHWLEHGMQRPALTEIYVFVPYARFLWNGQELCVRDSRFIALPPPGTEIAVLLHSDFLTLDERARLLASGAQEAPLNTERVLFLNPDTTTLFSLDEPSARSQLWSNPNPALLSRDGLELWLRSGR